MGPLFEAYVCRGLQNWRLKSRMPIIGGDRKSRSFRCLDLLLPGIMPSVNISKHVHYVVGANPSIILEAFILVVIIPRACFGVCPREAPFMDYKGLLGFVRGGMG